MRKIDILPYHLFRAEVDKLVSAFGSELVAVHQLGNAKLSGPTTKPAIDIWVEVRDIEKLNNVDLLSEPGDPASLDEFSQKMIQHGYTPRGELGSPGRRFFSRDAEPVGTYQVHVYQFGHFWPADQQNLAQGLPRLWVMAQSLGEISTAKTTSVRTEANYFLAEVIG
jgi:GrpB-like predicted nucleotidyltransferase (UPF0157 family)